MHLQCFFNGVTNRQGWIQRRIRILENQLNVFAQRPQLIISTGQQIGSIEADAAGSGREGRVHVRDVSIDGFTVPRMALEYFVSKYITPKYPNVGIDSQFQLPDKIDMATVGYHKVTVTQK